MSRRLRVGVALLVVLSALTGGIAWALPEVVRRVAIAQLSPLLDRSVSIEDVDLNLFTRRLAIKKFRLADRQEPAPFVEFQRADVGFSYWSLLRSDIRLTLLRLDGLTVRVVRAGPGEFNFSDLIEKFTKPTPGRPPSRWTYTVDRLEVNAASILAVDRHVAPATEWRIEPLGVSAAGLSTRAGRAPGTLRVTARVNGEAAVEIAGDSIQLAPLSIAAGLSLADFDLGRVRPYLPPGLPAAPRGGTLGCSLKIALERTGDELGKATVSGEVSLRGLSVFQREGHTAFLSVGRLGVAVKDADLVARAATVAVEIDGLDLKAARSQAGAIDLLSGPAPSEPGPPAVASPPSEAAPARGTPAFTVRLERLSLAGGSATFEDRAVSPAREWKLDGLTVDAGGLSTSAEDPPGKLVARARITTRPGAAKPATVLVQSDSVRLAPLDASVRLALAGFDLTPVASYLPGSLPAHPSGGTLGVDVTARVERGDAGLTRAAASGTVRLEHAAIVERGATAPFLTLPRVVVAIKDADALAHAVALARVEIEGLDARAVRDAGGRIDLLGLLAPAAESGAAPSATAPPVKPAPAPDARPAAPTAAPPGAAARTAGAGSWRLSLDRFTLTKGTATFHDRTLSPPAAFAATDLAITAEHLTWPPKARASLDVSLTMPGGGHTEIKGGGTLEPLNIQIAMGTRDAPIDPYQGYFPFAARFHGLFGGDSLSEIQRAPDGALIVASRGTAWARELEVRDPESGSPAARLAAMEIRGIDFSWPNYALVERVTLARPEVQIERDATGAINLRRLFEVRGGKRDAAGPGDGEPPAPAASPGTGQSAEERPAAAATAPAEKAGGPLQNMVLDFTEIRIEDGLFRFLDRTTTPAFSEDMSKVSLAILGLSNVLGRQRTTMSAQAVVGGDAALDLRGELSGIGETFHADLVGDLRDFSLAGANPYADQLTSWIVQRGKLTAKVHYRIDGDQLTAAHDVKFAGLNVARARESDEAKQRLGLPLGLAVALLKDRRGDIDFEIPLSGTLSDRKFNWGEAMWSAVKQVILKVLAAPFNAIGRMFTSKDDKVEALRIDPVTFAPGSSVIAPAAEQQLTRVADFLRRSPYVKVELTPTATAADVQDLKAREVQARLEQFQKEQGLADLAATVRAYYLQRAPDLTLPATVDEQIALLREREPVPASPLSDLVRRRLDNVRDRLVKAEGIPADRVVPAAAPAPDTKASGEGRVEFGILPE